MKFVLGAAVAACMAWLYAGIGKGLVVQWVTSTEASYGAIIAVVASTVVWERRRRIMTAARGSHLEWAGALLVAFGLSAYLAGIFAADLFTTRASFVVVAAGLVWLLAGTDAAMAAFAPLVFFLLAIPLPELVVTTLTGSLQTVAARTAETTLYAAGYSVYRDGNILELPSATLQIVEACSGLRSVVSLASVGVLLAWATPGPMIRRTAMVVATLPIAVVANGLRVAASGAAAEAWGPAMLRDPWHSLAGWLTFVVTLGALWGIRKILLREPPASRIPNPQVAAA
jgi:exosortase